MCYGTIQKRVVAFAIALTVYGLWTAEAFAQNYQNAPTIFDVRRSLPLDPQESVTHDFYINAGPEVGLKKGTYINVVRPVPVHDPIQNKQQATLNIPIGKLQIIHVEKNIAVGRLQSELGDDERPTVEFEAVMIGDRVDLASISTESAPKKLRTRKTAKVEEAQLEPVAPTRSLDPTLDPALEQRPAVIPAENVAPQRAPVVPSVTPTSAESEELPAPAPMLKKPFPVAQAPDMFRLEQLESDIY